MTIVTNVICITEYHKKDIRLCLFELIYDQMIIPSRTLRRKECTCTLIEKHEEVQLRHRY